MEVSASKPEITITLSYTEAQRLMWALWNHEGMAGLPIIPEREANLSHQSLAGRLQDIGVELP